MDPSHLIEDQLHNPRWAIDGQKYYQQITDRLPVFGTDDVNRQPLKGTQLPIVTDPMKRAPPALRKMNVYQNRYHLPSGLEYNCWRDLYGLYNSAEKPRPGYIDQEIKQNANPVWAYNNLS